MDAIQLEVQPRAVTGKKVRQLRRHGITPIHLYGRGVDPIAAQADTATLRRVVHQAGQNTPVMAILNDAQHFTFVREVQRHPTSGQLLHVDFFQVDIAQRMQGDVPVTLLGEAPAVRMHDALLNVNLYVVSVECLPTDMPHDIQVDLSALAEIGDAIRVRDLVAPPGVTILDDPEELVVRANPPRKEKVEEEAAPAELPTAVKEGKRAAEAEVEAPPHQGDKS